MNDLETRLREVEVPEPPLGFDPDEVADQAARHTRKRRTGIAVTAVAAASVVAAVVFAPSHPPAQPAAPPLPPSPAVQARINQALTDALARVLPGRRSLTVGQSLSDALTPGRMTTSAVFVDAAGRSGGFQLTVRDASTAQQVVALDRVCSERVLPGNCSQRPRPGGGVVVIRALDYPDGRGGTVRRAGEGFLYRPDGSTVAVVDSGGFSLTEEQLAQVIIDPAFVLSQ